MNAVSTDARTGVFQSTQTALMQVVTETAAALVTCAHWREVLPDYFPRVAAATGVDRMILFRLENHVDGKETGMVIGEWIGSDSQNIPATLGTHLPIKTPRYDYTRWMQLLRAGEVFSFSDVEKLPAGERPLLQRAGVKAIIRVPLMQRGKFWGALGFDHLSHVREWQENELITLGSLAKMLAACMERDGDTL